MNELIVEANIESLDTVTKFVNKKLTCSLCPPSFQGDINLAVEEVFTNIVNHAYQPAGGSAFISVAVANEEVFVRFEDMGKPYNPLEHPEPDFEKPVMERKIGGLGVFLVKRLMDSVEYARIDNKNILVIRKKITESCP